MGSKPTKSAAIVLTAICLVAGFVVPASASAGTKAMGIDVSRFQGPIDWPTVATAGIKFAFVQASRGSGLDCTVKPGQCGADPLFATNRVAAESNRIRVGAYHRAFASGGTIADARADSIAEATYSWGPSDRCRAASWSPCWTSRHRSAG